MAKILVAEDDRISQKLAVKIVEDLGHTAFVSPHGKHAYESLTASNRFDLLITDIMMPEMDGQQLIKTLRGDQQFMDLPIIIMSAVVGMSEISNLLKLGATLFLAKPLDRDELQNYIRRCLVKVEGCKAKPAA
ncbi:MAG: response regulator [Pseudodesulfovibrio sp.]|uniref:Response regulator receiver n=1 Tax=Pseudodesulfovibrio aespoeensis (strain ATCC 700646 / DSM 10631 / Aspo-2) TaxID=643562 RepID=E6VW87_PSEA9|nr:MULTISPECIES: response regulator [Pseudodesulfovibrio]MBU4193020.1 response regulator [Pseudomonadota bacterium]ADU63647.1 response regulator receiver [Pseudodesulfovibrio aespoeensis Aspo-2]MBU4244931.1 response regulator [Pseudomonadota bacterium]MBU4378816.1 response regulator [Pseudomonadota bacterium]MBU4475534.1 response regulator [Pseudomonadota bacterium]